MEKTVTPRQLEILRFIRDFRNRTGYSPSMQEIGDHLQLSKVTVFEHVGALEEKQLLLRGAKHKARSLQVCPEFVFDDEVPTGRVLLAGRIAAGQPIEAVQDDQYIDLGSMFESSGEIFALEVAGDSMVDDKICDGDYVICQRKDTARNGETVVALLDDGDATLKRFYKEKGKVRLQPANDNYDPIYVDRCKVQGIVIGVIRRM